jgi:hypothetical protein
MARRRRLACSAEKKRGNGLLSQNGLADWVVELGPLNGFQPKDWEEKEISFSYFSDFISNEIYLNSNDL